jgi:hypothetical protein
MLQCCRRTGSTPTKQGTWSSWPCLPAQDASFRGFVPLGVAAVGSASVAAYNEQVRMRPSMHTGAPPPCCPPAQASFSSAQGG